jgi:hypothetical protein
MSLNILLPLAIGYLTGFACGIWATLWAMDLRDDEEGRS